MVSRRTWASISMTMAALFFLFFFTGSVKDSWNNYNENRYYEASSITKNDQWRATSMTEREVVLIGGKNNSALNQIVKQWCTYYKSRLTLYDSVVEYNFPEHAKPVLILLDSGGIAYDDADVSMIYRWIEKGANIVFCTLPEPEKFRNSVKLANIVGIKAVYADKAEILGVEFYQGFLLGGNASYTVEKEEDEKRQDFVLEVPWYQTTSGIKAYALGVMDSKEVKKEFMPHLIWRNSIDDARIFAVNGDFMSKTEGIGILSAMVSESSDFCIYPVVNAQNLSIVNFPGFADENQEKTVEVYSRTMSGIYEDIIWPTVLALMESSKNKITFLLSPQYDYEDEYEPIDSQFEYQMKLINGAKGEAGLSMARAGRISLMEKLEKDSEYFSKNNSEYQFGAFYSSRADISGTASMQRTTLGSNMTTITSEFQEGQPVLSFLTDRVTLQSGTIDGFSHTYRENLRIRSIETALGYSNIFADFHTVFWPEEEGDTFEKKGRYFASYTDTYWRPFQDFEKTTLSESDRRIRQFLALDYRTVRKDKTVSLDVMNVTGPSWFILRTHGEAIWKITGGSYKKVEKDVYLIQADQPHVEISLLETDSDRYFYIE